MNQTEILIQARALISEPGTHCQWALARNATGQSIGPCDKEAVSYCVGGALMRAEGNGYATTPVTNELLRHDGLLGQVTLELFPAYSQWDRVVRLNNTEGQEAILRVLDEAISRSLDLELAELPPVTVPV